MTLSFVVDGESSMPIYEYRCPQCRGRFTTLVLRLDREAQPHCPRCGNDEVQRLISRFSTVRSEDEHLEALADPAMLSDVDENDPRSIARWARRMRRAMGDELGEDFDELIDELESGEWEDDEMGGEAGSADENLGWV
jgi:putative FmdB family regulatory protein